MKTITILITLVGLLDCHAQPKHVEPYFAAVIVSHADSAASWYAEVLDLKERNRIELPERGIKQVILQSDKLLLELIEVRSSYAARDLLADKEKGARLRGHFKIGFFVENLDAFHKYLEELKVTFFGNVITDPVSGDRTFLVHDPDGNIIQFFGK